MNVYLDTLGCRLNEAEIQSWARGFSQVGHHVVPSPRDAQLLILNTCSVTGEATRKSRQFIRRLQRQNPSAQLVVTGCYAELEPGEAGALTGVDLIVGNHDKEGLVEEILARLDFTRMPDAASDPDTSHVHPWGRTRAFVKVQDGCRHRCTFCVVTVARGEERSRSIADLVQEVRELHRAGYQEAVLTGVHLGGYGQDLGTDLHGLVTTLLAETTIPRLRLSSLEPWDLPAGFWDLWRNPRLMPHLHLPLQSGADATLRRMGRRCTVAHFQDLARSARRAIEDLTLTTDVIVGFPGESAAQWCESLDAIAAIGFGHIHIFTYSPRLGTAAAHYPDQVPDDIKRARSRALHELMTRMKVNHLRRFVGDTREVLWETTTVTRSPETTGQQPAEAGGRTWSGYTDNYLRVEMVAPEGIDLTNTILPVRLEACQGDRLRGGVLAGAALP
jgi:threonylcarbamoyladenosine tRNA methylthiotransferase MtaB